MLRRLRRLAVQTEEEEEAQSLSVSSACCVSASPKQDKLRRHPRMSGPRRSQVDRVPSWPGAPKTQPTRKLSTASHRTKPLENQVKAKKSTPTRKIHGIAECSTMVTPPPSPRRPSTTTSPKRDDQNYLPPPKSPLRLTLRRKASKPPKKTKSQIIREKVELKYDDNGTLQRTTVTRIRNSDGSSSTEKHKECLSPTSPRYCPKPKMNQIRQGAMANPQCCKNEGRTKVL